MIDTYFTEDFGEGSLLLRVKCLTGSNVLLLLMENTKTNIIFEGSLRELAMKLKEMPKEGV